MALAQGVGSSSAWDGQHLTLRSRYQPSVYVFPGFRTFVEALVQGRYSAARVDVFAS